MHEEEALQRVAFLNSATNLLLDLVLVLWAIFVVTAGPVVTCSRLVRDALTSLEDVLQLAIKDLVVNNTTFRVYNYRARLQVIDLASSLKVYLPILTGVHVPEEAAEGLVVNQVLVVLDMFTEGELPEPQANLIPALSNLDGNNFSWHLNSYYYKICG